MSQHIVSRKTYFAVFFALLALLALTVLAAEMEAGPLALATSMAIAVAKATLIVVFFMHVGWNNALTRLFVLGGFVWLAILFVLTMGDYASRSPRLDMGHNPSVSEPLK